MRVVYDHLIFQWAYAIFMNLGNLVAIKSILLHKFQLT